MSDVSKLVEELSPEQRDLLGLLLSRKKAGASPSRITPQGRESNTFPLSFAQQRLWILNQFAPESSAYNLAGAVRLEGPLDRAALEASIGEIARRHEALRTTFEEVDGEPAQVINPAPEVGVPVSDASSLSGEEREAEVLRLAREEAARPMDLAGGPLLRARLLRLGEEEHVLLLTMHHIISDAWSMGVFVREMAALYKAFREGGRAALPELPIQYADFAVWQRRWLQGEVLESQLSYWKRRLEGAPAILELPADRPRPAVQSLNGARHLFALPAATAEALRGVGERQGATLFMVLFAAFNVLLKRYTGQDDLVVGVPIAGRNRSETSDVIGFFINTLPLRTELDGDPTFDELLSRVRASTLEAYDHQDLPFERLVDELQPERDLSHSPLFQVMFNLKNAPMPPMELAGLKLTPVEVGTGTSKFDLMFDVSETAGGLEGWFDYNTDLFDAATVERLAAHLRNLLDSAAEDPSRRVSELPMMSEGERRQILFDWNDTEHEFQGPPSLHQMFEEQAARTPDAPALTFEGEHMTFGELNRRANQVAHRLRAHGAGPEVLVGVMMERSLELMVAFLGVLKSGAAYVPLDPDYPLERLAFMLEDTKAPVVLSARGLARGLEGRGPRVVYLDDESAGLERESAENPNVGVSADNLCYVIYTSGSTGQPKGAMLHHGGVRNRLLWGINDYRLGPGDVVLQKTPISFDVSVWEIFAPLCCGARMVIARPGGHRDSAYIAELIEEQRVTHADFVPAMMQVFLDDGAAEKYRSLKLITCAGEALGAELRERFFGLTDAELYNLYGPTEASVAVTYWRCRRDGRERVIPIGHPMTNTRVHILGRDLRPVPVGVAGELHIGGVAPARGYLNRADLTAEKFIPDAYSRRGGERLYKTGDLACYQPDGSILFLGRMDDQLKIRGMRMELGEVEAVLTRHPSVGEAAVLAHESAAKDKFLVAYVVARPGEAATRQELQDFLRELLPDFMVPSHFVMLDAMPLTQSGKVNRRALPRPQEEATEFVAPESELERIIADVWQKVLNVERVGVHHNFFDLGGNSLRMTQAHSKLRTILGRDIQMLSLFKYPTVHTLAKSLGEGGEARPAAVEAGREQAETRKRMMQRRRQPSAARQSK
ncbi:MAG TPA: amino acid adenylation domain-containing protein [Pyrinomonadaceae bacterium]|jgi:amino acid adenylation domain-containing protein|nr:amino acid adenylation domain-containing protein [Pyrinomonadaceae bacterium]